MSLKIWYDPPVYMWSNDNSPCLMTQRDPLKSDRKYVTKQICLENRCKKNKYMILVVLHCNTEILKL